MRKLRAILSLARAARRPVVYALPGMDEVQVQKDLAYKENGRTWHQLDVYSPPSAPGKTSNPAVILVHGGAKASSKLKNTRPFVSWGQLFATSGISAITFNWDYPEGAQIIELIDYVRQNAGPLNVDKDRLCIFAFSGGVEFAVPTVLKGTPEYVRCIVATLRVEALFAQADAIEEAVSLARQRADARRVVQAILARAFRGEL